MNTKHAWDPQPVKKRGRTSKRSPTVSKNRKETPQQFFIPWFPRGEMGGKEWSYIERRPPPYQEIRQKQKAGVC